MAIIILSMATIYSHIAQAAQCGQKLLFVLIDPDKEVDSMKACEAFINEKYGDGTLSLTVKESYRNMAEKIKDHMHLVENAFKAIESLGGTPVSNPVRGGTDGARLSFMGLPCPNLSAGGMNFHGRFEYISVQAMQNAVNVIVEIAKLVANK